MTPETVGNVTNITALCALLGVIGAFMRWFPRYMDQQQKRLDKNDARQQELIDNLIANQNNVAHSQIRAMEDMASAIRETGQALQSEHVTIIAEVRGLRGGLKRNAS